MKKLFSKVTAAISAAAMLAVPAINVNADNNTPKKDYLVNNRYYHRVVWTEYGGPTAYRDVLVGDVNKTNTITEADATAILQYLSITDPQKKEEFKKKIDLCAADVDGNGDVDKRDAELINYFVSGLINHVAGYQRYDNNWIWKSTNDTYRVFINADNSYTTILVGDVNNDKKVTYADITAINQANSTGQGFHIFGSDYRRAGRAADINNDGAVISDDLKYLYDYMDGNIENFDDIH